MLTKIVASFSVSKYIERSHDDLLRLLEKKTETLAAELLLDKKQVKELKERIKSTKKELRELAKRRKAIFKYDYQQIVLRSVLYKDLEKYLSETFGQWKYMINHMGFIIEGNYFDLTAIFDFDDKGHVYLQIGKFKYYELDMSLKERFDDFSLAQQEG